MTDSVRVGGVTIQTGQLHDVRDALDKAGSENAALSFKFINSYSVALASHDKIYAGALADRSVNYPDGTPLAWLISMLLGPGESQRAVRGPDVFTTAMLQPRNEKLKHFLLGGTEESLDAIRQRISASESPLRIVGSWSPPFVDVDEMVDEAERRIKEANPDIVWVGLGTPKQDLVSAALVSRSGGTFACVGAAFDFFAGTAAEAPPFLRGSGFEWVYRFMREPKRLWRRYFFGNARFVMIALRELVRR